MIEHMKVKNSVIFSFSPLSFLLLPYERGMARSGGGLIAAALIARLGNRELLAFQMEQRREGGREIIIWMITAEVVAQAAAAAASPAT